jgi:hypothetical protein
MRKRNTILAVLLALILLVGCAGLWLYTCAPSCVIDAMFHFTHREWLAQVERDMKTIAKALECYRADQGVFPVTADPASTRTVTPLSIERSLSSLSVEGGPGGYFGAMSEEQMKRFYPVPSRSFSN